VTSASLSYAKTAVGKASADSATSLRFWRLALHELRMAELRGAFDTFASAPAVAAAPRGGGRGEQGPTLHVRFGNGPELRLDGLGPDLLRCMAGLEVLAQAG